MTAREVINRAMWDRFFGSEDIGDWDVKRGADDVLAALREAGYAVVPVEPTEAMIEAGHFGLVDKLPVTFPARTYRAMIAAHTEGK